MISVAELREQMEIVHQICIENLETLNDDVLAECLQPLPFEHPVADSIMSCSLTGKWLDAAG